MKKVYHSYKFYFLISIFLLIGLFISYMYIDSQSLIVWSTNVWDCIFGEGLRNFYVYTSQNHYAIAHEMVGNDILIYLPWALWNFPIWIIQRITNISINSNILMMTYAKSFLLFVLSGIFFITKRICSILKIEQTSTRQVLLLMGTSIFTLLSVAYAGQNDILPIFFFLLGLLYLLKDKQCLFIVFAAISIAMKPYMLFSFVIIILLKEKNIGKVIGKIVGGASIFIVQKLILMSFPMYYEATHNGAATGEITLLLKAKLSIANYDVSVLVLALGAIAILAYLSKPKVEEMGRYIIYYATIPLLVIFAFSGFSFYRPVYLVPLVYIMMVMNKKIPIQFNLFFETIMVFFMYYPFLRTEVLFLNPYFLNQSIMGKISNLQIEQGNSFCEVFTARYPNFGFYFVITEAIVILAILVLIISNHPRISSKMKVEEWEEKNWVWLLRIGTTLLLFALPVLLWRSKG